MTKPNFGSKYGGRVACRERKDFFLSIVVQFLHANKFYSPTSISQYFSKHKDDSTGNEQVHPPMILKIVTCEQS